MSTENLVDNIQANLVLDPRIDIDEVPHYNILKGSEYVRYNQNISTSYSTSSAHFSVVPPNKDIVVDKKIYIDLEFQFQFTGDAGVGNLMLPSVTYNGVDYLAGQTDALRYMAFQQICENLSITFNQTTVSQNLSDYLEALTRAGFTDKYENHDLSVSPSMHDQFQELGDWNIWGAARNPLNSYGNNSTQQPRGGLEYIITANTQTAATVLVKWSELLLISPLAMTKLEHKGFLGLTNIDFTFNLGDLSRMWCHDTANNWTVGGAVPAINVSWTKAPQLRLCYLTPPKSEVLPYINKYPYTEINRYPTDSGSSLAAGSSNKISGNNIQLSSIPKRMFIVVREKNADRNYTKADAYARIDGVEIQFNNKNALLGSATSRDLFELSVRNGLQMSWAQWNQFCGSVLCVDFGNDISLGDAEAVGSFGQFQLQVDVNYTNIGSQAKNYALYLIIASEGVFTMEGTSSRLNVGNVFPHNVLEGMQLADLERVPYHQQTDYVGGSFMGFLRRMGRKLGRALHKGIKFGKKALPMIQEYGPKAVGIAEKIAPMLLAAGYSSHEIHSFLGREAVAAGSVTSGARATRKNISRRRN